MRSNLRTVVARPLGAWLALAVLTGCGTGLGESHAIADYPHYPTGAELIGAADLIVRAVAVDSRVEMSYPELSTDQDPTRNPQAGLPSAEVERHRSEQGLVVTVTRVRVTEVLKGRSAVGDLVPVSQPGGEFDGTRHTEAGTTMLSTRPPLDYVLFLSTYGGHPYHLVNPGQGMSTVVDGERLEPVGDGPGPGFTTLAELRSAVTAAG